MSERIFRELGELGSLTMAHASLITALVGILKNKGLLDQAEINEVFDLALVGVENAPGVPDEVRDGSRQMLESMGRTMGGEVR